jgi:ribonuclease E
MPIFVSRFSAERIASSGLQRTRNNRQAENRGSARSERHDRAERGERTERGRGSQRGERAQDQLPVATQTAESIREELESRRTGGSRGESAGESQADEQRRQSLAEPPTLPGVSTVNTRSKTSAAAPQVGRLDRESSNPHVQSTLNRFESLRNAGSSASGNARSAEVRQAFRDIPSEAQGFAGVQARRLNAQVDASIRLQRSNQGGQGNANGVD